MKREEMATANPRPCSACPWRISNQGTRHPHGFYTKANLDRLWRGLRTGDAVGMTCHPTDPEMAVFAGYETTADRHVTHECAGSVILMMRELMRFQAITLDVEALISAGGKVQGMEALRRYRAAAGRAAMTRRGLMEFSWRNMVVLPGAIPIDRKAIGAHINDPDVGLPGRLPDWDPAIIPRSQRSQRR